jgi:hypothetical protein
VIIERRDQVLIGVFGLLLFAFWIFPQVPINERTFFNQASHTEIYDL